jgi:hypothetical protein
LWFFDGFLEVFYQNLLLFGFAMVYRGVLSTPAVIWFCNGLQEVFDLPLLPYGFAPVGWRVVANQINFMVP